MIAGPWPFSRMRDSGVSSLAEVSERWEVVRLRNAAEMRVSNVDKHSKADEQTVRLCNYADVYKNDRIRSSMAFMRATATADEIERFRLQPGDVLITKDSETWNDIGVPALVEDAADDLISGYHLALLRPLPRRTLGPYLFRALQSTAVSHQFHVQANGVTRYGLSHSAIKSTWIPLPPLPEQAAIVRFLDHADRGIRRYIGAKQKLIRLLEEQKQAIIHRTVTRGLDPRVRVRASGVEWLGDVPEHWEVLPLRKRWTVTDCKHLTVPFVDDGIPLASVREVQSFDLDLATSKRISREWYEALIQGTRSPRQGDIIYCRNVSVGAAAFVNTNTVFAMGQDVCLIRSDDQNQRYLNYFIHSPAMDRQLALLLVGSTFKRINVADIKGLIIAVPPAAEQEAIAAYLDQELAQIDRALTSNRREINLMREYRTRMIADVVTGELDVRDAAARLPDAAEEPEPLDEPEMLNAEDSVPDDLVAAAEGVNA